MPAEEDDEGGIDLDVLDGNADEPPTLAPKASQAKMDFETLNAAPHAEIDLKPLEIRGNFSTNWRPWGGVVLFTGF